MIKTAVELMQLCQIHFYQKIARKKVARVNAVLHLHFDTQILAQFFSSGNRFVFLHCFFLVTRELTKPVLRKAKWERTNENLLDSSLVRRAIQLELPSLHGPFWSQFSRLVSHSGLSLRSIFRLRRLSY